MALVWIARFIGFGIGWVLSPVFHWMWNNKKACLYILAGMMVVGFAIQGYEALRYGTVSQRTQGMSVSILRTGMSTDTNVAFQPVIDLQITNESATAFRAFSVRCGMIDVDDYIGIGPHETVTREYTRYISTALPGPCSITDAPVR